MPAVPDTEEVTGSIPVAPTNGLVWSRVPHAEAVFGAPRNQAVYSVVVGGPGLVAVGMDGSGDDADETVGVTPPPG